VDLRVAMSSNISIPHAVEQIQTQIKRYLAASSGIELREVSVSVERAEGDDVELPVEPLAHAAEMMAVAAAHAQEEEVSMHQRVFGRDTTKSVAEQVAEAEAIAPPEEEQAEIAEEALQTEESDLPSAEKDTEFAQENGDSGEAAEEPGEEIVSPEAVCVSCDAESVVQDVEEEELLFPEPELVMEEETEIAQEGDEATWASEDETAEVVEEAAQELPVYEMQDDFVLADDVSDEADDENSDAEAQE